MASKNVKIIAAVLIIAIVAIAAYLTVAYGAPTTVADGDNVSVYYTGAFTNGTVFNTNVGGQPLNFTVGANEVIEGFDQGVIGMSVGQNKTITVPPDQGYGVVNPALIVSVPMTAFGNASIANGMIVTASDGQEGVVESFNTTNAIVDFNPPLAGQTLVFNIKVVVIKR